MHFLDNNPFTLLDTEILPIEVTHYKIDIFGYKFKNTAYITDASAISDAEKDKLRNLDYFIINCLRKDSPHPAHFILPQILELVEELQPKQTYLTHLSHHIGFHDEMNQELPSHIQLAFDGQEIVFNFLKTLFRNKNMPIFALTISSGPVGGIGRRARLKL